MAHANDLQWADFVVEGEKGCAGEPCSDLLWEIRREATKAIAVGVQLTWGEWIGLSSIDRGALAEAAMAAR